MGISHININDSDILLDIGCGGGANVKKFSEIARNGRIYGLDYSEFTVEKSIQSNKSAINEEKLRLFRGLYRNFHLKMKLLILYCF